MTRRWIAVPFLLLAASIALLGCSPKITEFYPLMVGNLWTFNTITLVDNTERQDMEAIVSRAGQTYIFNNGETIINVADHSLINKDGFTLLKAPIRKGETWVEFGVEIKITEIGKTYTVPAGTFSDTLEITWQAKRQDAADPQKIYKDITVTRFAKNVGPIYYYYEVINPDGKPLPVIKSELVKFENVRAKEASGS